MRDNVEIGRRAKFVGDNFEEWVNKQHEKAKWAGILAHVEKTQAHSKIVHGRLIYTECGIADYIGTLEGGRSLACEAKSTKEEYFYRVGVSKKQQDHLEIVARAGGLALLVIEFRRHGVKVAIPWLEVPWHVMRTAERVELKDVKEKWAIVDVYLSRWHEGGPRSSNLGTNRRVFARE